MASGAQHAELEFILGESVDLLEVFDLVRLSCASRFLSLVPWPTTSECRKAPLLTSQVATSLVERLHRPSFIKTACIAAPKCAENDGARRHEQVLRDTADEGAHRATMAIAVLAVQSHTHSKILVDAGALGALAARARANKESHRSSASWALEALASTGKHLSQFKSIGAASLLVELLHDSEAATRCSAATTIERLTERDTTPNDYVGVIRAGAVGVLLEMLRDDVESAKARALSALCTLAEIDEGTHIARANGFPILVNVLRQGTVSCKEAAAEVLLVAMVNNHCNIVAFQAAGGLDSLVALAFQEGCREVHHIVGIFSLFTDAAGPTSFRTAVAAGVVAALVRMLSIPDAAYDIPDILDTLQSIVEPAGAWSSVVEAAGIPELVRLAHDDVEPGHDQAIEILVSISRDDMDVARKSILEAGFPVDSYM
eukprot:gnl/TRDRNA2_/TRDRNA2_133657_c0_seq1.p1 gnl/TRDRNA2_/TRDRNA2_133657_c0~~gnl/TRDRNA2_/TRDRNA2_133657_c0_seq1.p1  ORF type:complete len:455 (+),score=50.02 gnl/TRDRNA2_/TRDRNA2_133657_c0_seq1:78-1367(+)